MSGLRPIVGLSRDSLRGLIPGRLSKGKPRFEWVDPRSLFVEADYQRDVGQKGVKLVRAIYAGFDWARFKPPVCIELEGSRICIDGQHTAIACASHPGIQAIPIMIVEAVGAAGRAAAFVGHNRDRVGLTPMAIYRAELAGGDDVARLIAQACGFAGVKVLDQSVNLRNPAAVGATIAVGTLRSVVKRYGVDLLARALKVLVAAKRGPVKAGEIAAAAMILAALPKKVGIDDELTRCVASKTAESWAAIAAVHASDSGEPLGSAIAAVWCRNLNVRLAAFRKGPPVPLRATSPPAQKAPQVPAQPRPQAAPAPLPPKKPPEPSVQAAPPAPPTPPPNGERIRRNGVVLDMLTGVVLNRGKRSIVLQPDARRLVAALLNVMPALLDFDRLAKKAFGAVTPDSRDLLRGLVDDVNSSLRLAQLEIRTVPKMGNTLFDLGA